MYQNPSKSLRTGNSLADINAVLAGEDELKEIVMTCKLLKIHWTEVIQAINIFYYCIE